MESQKNPLMYRPAVRKGPHVVTNDEFMDEFLPYFASHLRDHSIDPKGAKAKARHIACNSMKIERRYFVRPLKKVQEYK